MVDGRCGGLLDVLEPRRVAERDRAAEVLVHLLDDLDGSTGFRSRYRAVDAEGLLPILGNVEHEGSLVPPKEPRSRQAGAVDGDMFEEHAVHVDEATRARPAIQRAGDRRSTTTHRGVEEAEVAHRGRHECFCCQSLHGASPSGRNFVCGPVDPKRTIHTFKVFSKSLVRRGVFSAIIAIMNPDDINNLAKLARMELSEVEKTSLAADMKNILAFVDQIKEADIDMDAAGRVGPVYNVFREDANPHETGIYTETLVSAAPEREGNFVKVKKIL